MHSPSRGFALAIMAPFCWSFSGPGIGILLNRYGIAPLTIAFWRDAFVTALLLPITVWQFGLPARHDWRHFGMVGLICFGVYHALWVLSVEYNGAAVAVILIYTFPACATLGAWLLWREQPTSMAMGGLLLAEPLGWPQVMGIALVLMGAALPQFISNNMTGKQNAAA